MSAPAFAGDDISIARYYPEDDEFLLEKNEHVEHWEVVSLTETPYGE